MATYRSEETDVALICRVKMTPSLYDPRNPDFRLAYRKEQDWELVASKLGLSSADARRRWTCLRDRYSRELKLLLLHPDRPELGKSQFFRQMDFLRKFVRKRRNRRRAGFDYDSQSADDSKVSKTTRSTSQLQDKPNTIELEEEEAQEYDIQEYDDGNSNTYTGKMDENTMDSDDYPEFVDDVGEVYEECVETPMNEEKIKSNSITVTAAASQYNPPPPQPSNRSVVYNPSSSTSLIRQHTISPTSAITFAHARPANEIQHVTQQVPHQGIANYTPYQQNVPAAIDTEDDLFGKSIAVYLKQLSRRHKIKAQVEMFQILEKYIELEESAKVSTTTTTSTQHK